MHQQLSLHPVKTLAQSAQEYSRCVQWNSPQNKVRSQKSSHLKHFMKGSSCIFCLVLLPGLQEVFLLRNMLVVAFLPIWKTMKLIFCCKYVLDICLYGFHSLYDSIAIPAPIPLLLITCIVPTLTEEYAMRAVFRLCEDWSVYSPLS